MKILICTGIYPPDIGGPATYSELIARELSLNHNVVVLTYGARRPIFNFPTSLTTEKPFGFVAPADTAGRQFSIFNVGRKYPLPIRYFLYFLKVLKLGKDADIIYVQDPVSVGLPTTLANLILKKKLILKIVGDYSWEQARQMSNARCQMSKLDDFYPFKKENYPRKINTLRKIQLWVAKRAGKIITPSLYLKNILIRGWRIAENKIKVIYNSFDISVIASPVIGTRQSQPFRILSVGRLVPWKGFDTLIDVVKDLPNTELEIIGDGPLLENFKFQISNFKLEDRGKLLGKLSHDEVVQKMCSSDLFVLNSGYEGLSHVILEAMACELPVVVSRAGGNTELVGANEERGCLFDYNNKEQIKEKINYIISHLEEAREKAKKARDFVASFAKDKMIEKLEQELKD